MSYSRWTHTHTPQPSQKAQYQGPCPPRLRGPSWWRKTSFLCVFCFHDCVNVFVCAPAGRLSLQQNLLHFRLARSTWSHSTSVTVSTEDDCQPGRVCVVQRVHVVWAAGHDMTAKITPQGEVWDGVSGSTEEEEGLTAQPGDLDSPGLTPVHAHG